MEFASILFLAVLGLVALTVVKGIYVVRQQEAVVVERLGRFHRLFESGLNVIIPFLDQPRHIQWVRNGIVVLTDRIDLREVVLDIAEQRVITKDNVGITVDAIIYMQLLDPKRAAYEIQSLPLAVSQLTQTTLRNLVGEMELDATLSSRDAINTRLKTVLDEATDKWGLKVNRVELKNINPRPRAKSSPKSCKQKVTNAHASNAQKANSKKKSTKL
jgi:regulator of protease activity HflC (stomatin/prohibitin superfamily)